MVKLFNAVKTEDLSGHTALTFHAYCVLDNKPVRFMAVVAVLLFVKVAAFKVFKLNGVFDSTLRSAPR